jgi:flavin-dependent dehydrogenase
LARTLHPELCDPAKSRPGSWFGLKTHLRSDAGRLEGRIELHLFQGGYAGIGEVEDDRLNLCLLVSVRALRACGGSADRVLAERVLANPAALRSLGGLSRCGSWKAVGPLRFGPRRGSAAGALFVGDSAGTIDPFCGEGISNALRGAELALPFALEGAQRGGIDGALARGYDAAWHGEFGSVTRRARVLGRLFESPRAAAAVLWLLRGVGRRLVPRLVAATRTGCAMSS